MPGSGTAEIYFIAIMMLLILAVCVVTVFFFAKTYKKEMAEKKKRQADKDVLNTSAEKAVVSHKKENS